MDAKAIIDLSKILKGKERVIFWVSPATKEQPYDKSDIMKLKM